MWVDSGARSTLVDIGGLPGVPRIRFKFDMPGCGCFHQFKGYIDEPFDKLDTELALQDIRSFMKLFLYGNQVSVNYCARCGKKLPEDNDDM